MYRVTLTEIIVAVMVILLTVAVSDCATGYLMNKFVLETGVVLDKTHTVNSDKDGHKTHSYALTVSLKDKIVEADASSVLYHSAKVNDSCEVSKRVGYSGFCYGYTATRVVKPPAERP